MLLHQFQHLGELGEHQDTATLFQELWQAFRQPIQFGAFLNTGGLVQFYQTRVDTALAQLQQCVEKFDMTLRHTLARHQLADALFHTDAQAFIQCALFAAELHILDGLGFRRQFTGHLSLGASQHEGMYLACQFLLPIGIAVAFDRRAIGLGESLATAQ